MLGLKPDGKVHLAIDPGVFSTNHARIKTGNMYTIVSVINDLLDQPC